MRKTTLLRCFSSLLALVLLFPTAKAAHNSRNLQRLAPQEELPLLFTEPLVQSSSESAELIQFRRPEDAFVPPPVAQVIQPGNASVTSSSSSTSAATPQQPPSQAQITPAPPKIGTLTSLLDPPPNSVTPLLNDAQQANLPLLKPLRQGIATVVYQRAVGNYDGVGMNCGMGYLNDYFKDNFVGVPPSIYGASGESCGLCVKVFCVDTVCENALIANRTFIISDSCKECKGNSIVIAARGAAALSGVNYNDNPSIQVAWLFTPCSPLIEGGIRLLPSDNNSPVFLGLNFSNLKVVLRAVSINGLMMKRTSYGQWVIDTPGQNIPIRPPYALQMVGANNQPLNVRITALVPQDLGVNFNA